MFRTRVCVPLSGVLVLLSAVTLADCRPASAQSSVERASFEGQTIRIAVGTTAGAATDVLARQLAPFISRHLPGKPIVAVENRPGAGGVGAGGYIYNLAKPDGLVVGFLTGAVTQGLIGGENIRFDPAKFGWIGAISSTQVLLAHKGLELSHFRDLLKPAKPLVMSSIGNNSSPDMANRLFLDMIGAKYQFVSGYPGQPEAILALGRGEANITNAGHTVYLSRRASIRAEGIYDAILQRGEYAVDGTFQRNKQMNDIPTTFEAIAELNPSAMGSVDFAAYRGIVGAFTVHFGFVLPPGTPPAIFSTMRKAWSDALNDPEARKAVTASLKVDFDFVDGEASQRLVEKIRADYYSDARIAARLNQLMATK